MLNQNKGLITPSHRPAGALSALSLVFFLTLFFSSSSYAWTDDPLSPGQRVKAVHISELQNPILQKTTACQGGPPAPVWSGAANANAPIRSSQLNELRVAVKAIYDAKGQGALLPSSISSNTQAGQPITASYINDLRLAVDTAVPGCAGPCGNGVLNPGETCDDSNLANGDGCNSSCQCECAAWADDACGASGCPATDMHQTRNCPVTIAQCAQSQCVGNAACGVSCSDGIQNQGEAGVDCGGPCPACPSCSDGIQNQGEDDIDCGGPCPACGGGSCVGACGDGVCCAMSGEGCASCPDDCGYCCGNASCDPGEDCNGCNIDCGQCPYCGDGWCNNGEDCGSCSSDCGDCGGPPPPENYCGDGSCYGGESCGTCEADCGACEPDPPPASCGDGSCNGGEDCGSCSGDCGDCCNGEETGSWDSCQEEDGVQVCHHCVINCWNQVTCG